MCESLSQSFLGERAGHVDHAGLINDEQVTGERMLYRSAETAVAWVVSSRPWMVLPVSPVASERRLAARPLGAHRATRTCRAMRILRMALTRGGVADARAVGDDQDLRGQREVQRRLLARGQPQTRLALDPGDPPRQKETAPAIDAVGDHFAGLKLQRQRGLDQTHPAPRSGASL